MEAVQELSLREENTAFSRLLEVMRSGYLQESLLKSTAERLQLTELQLQSMKQQYLECDTLYSCLCQSVGSHGAVPCVEAAEVQHCLWLCPDQNALGVEGERVRKRASNGVGRTAIQESVEHKLKVQCLRLVQWQDSGEALTGSETLGLAKAKQLPQVLTQQLAELREVEAKLDTRKLRQKLLHTQWKALCEMCEELNTIVESYKLGMMAKDDAVTLSHLQSQCHAMLGKQEVMQYQLVKGICSEGRLKALQQLRLHLIAAKHEVEEKLRQIRQNLEHYRSYGKKFVALASEYQQLLAEIENKQWALSELGKSLL